MNGYCDIHNHSIYGVDDGADSPEKSIAMLRMAYEDGTRAIILTPHAHYRRGQATPAEIREKAMLLQEQVKDSCPGLRLYPGNELYYDSSLPERIEAGEICCLADTGYVLVEFSTGEDFSYIKRALQELLCLGVVPILAHVERYSCLYEKESRVDEVCDMGVYLQANAESVLGEGSKAAKKFVRRLLKHGMIQFIASDAHDTTHRTPRLSECFAYIRKKYGDEMAKACFQSNPERLIKNELL